jgi:hypothetical protein
MPVDGQIGARRLGHEKNTSRAIACAAERTFTTQTYPSRREGRGHGAGLEEREGGEVSPGADDQDADEESEDQDAHEADCDDDGGCDGDERSDNVRGIGERQEDDEEDKNVEHSCNDVR